jgi:DNA-binding MarR family transcriptional regulator
MTEARWLDDVEAGAWRGLWVMSHLLFDRLNRELERRSGLSLAEYHVLARLADASERGLRMSALAEDARCSRSRLSHQIDRMEAAGLVSRVTCPTDRRGAFAVLTPKGRHALEAAAPGYAKDVRTYLIDVLTREQLEQLAAIASAVEARAMADDEAHCPKR